MTGANQQRHCHGGNHRSRATVLVWLLTALSILQWTVPPVDPDLLARLGGGNPGSYDAAFAEWQDPAVEARAPSSPIAFEKRTPGSRAHGPGADDLLGAETHPPVTLTGRATAAAGAPADGRNTLAGNGFTARSPPAAG